MVVDLYDFHSHILPEMDDGYQTAQDSVQALKRSYAQGVRHLVATPHYYPEETVDEFLKRREEAYKRLQAAMEEDGGEFPKICLGAEVSCYPSIGRASQLEQLCIGSSDYLLLELPFRQWGMEVLRDVQSICNTGRFTPILAHIERYLPIQSREAIQKILSLDVLLQMNAEFILERKTRRLAKKMLRDSEAFLLGSDCHNLTDRSPELGTAVEKLKGVDLERAVEMSTELSMSIWEQAMA